MNTLAPPSLTSIRPGPRTISPPRTSASQAAVASGSGLRKWTWSQVTVGMVVSPQVDGRDCCCCAANLAADGRQFHPRPHGPVAAKLSGLGETISALGDY